MSVRKHDAKSVRKHDDLDSFVNELSKIPIYKKLNIEKELYKMDAWLLLHPKRKKSKRFILNWLNKAADQSQDKRNRHISCIDYSKYED